MITINAVPTRTPVPIVDMTRSCRWESENDRGREPARNELVFSISHKPIQSSRETYAIVIRLLKPSSINRPSHMVLGSSNVVANKFSPRLMLP